MMDAKETKYKRITTAVILLLSILGVAAILVATRWGVGITPDSIAYIGGARSLAAGQGYAMPGNELLGTQLITHYPPFYSILLAGGGWLGIEPIVGARILNALLFGGIIALVGLLLLRLFKGVYPTGYWVSLAGSMLVFSSYTIIEIHTMAWTEPAFIFLSLLGFILLAHYLTNSKLISLMAAAVLMGFALITRYAGIAVVFSGMAGILLFARSAWLKRILTIILFSFVSLGFTLLWVFRNQGVAGTATNRDIYLRPFNVSHIWEMLDTFSAWLLIPQTAPTILKALVFLLIGLGIFSFVAYSMFRNGARQEASNILENVRRLPVILKLFLLYLPAYAGVLLVTNSLLDTYTPLDGRILSPIFVPLLILSLYPIGLFFHYTLKNKTVRLAAVSFAVLFLVVYLIQGSRLVLNSYSAGLGFNSLEWSQSNLLPQLDQLPSQVAIYSNAPEAVYIHTGRPANKIPRKNRTVDDLLNENFDTEWALMTSQIEAGVGVIIYFDVPYRRIPQFEEEFETGLPLDVFVQSEQGTIYVSKQE